MGIAIDKEFRVLVTQAPVSEPNGQPRQWRATALGFPGIAEEGASREQVIRQIQARIVEILRHSEIVTLTVPALPLTKEDEELLAQGWDDHGLFKDDPEALKLFDELELALDLFKNDEVSLGRAAEIAGLDRWQFEEILSERSIPIVIEADSAEAMDKELAFFFVNRHDRRRSGFDILAPGSPHNVV